jgi:hypothetical protein
LGVDEVWTNRLTSRKQAEDDAPGTVIHTPQPEAMGTPSWLILRKGLGLYTGYDGGDSKTDTLCATPGDYHAYTGVTATPNAVRTVLEFLSTSLTSKTTMSPMVKRTFRLSMSSRTMDRLADGVIRSSAYSLVSPWERSW